MLVAASTECFRHLELQDALDKLVDLEFSNVEIALHEEINHLKPSDVAKDLERAVLVCRSTNRLDVVAFSIEINAQGEAYYDQFRACCKLAKATKVVTLIIPSAEFGTPFNEEVERLRKLVAIAELDGARVSIRSQIGRLSEDPDTVGVLCNNVKGLGLTLDPSHYLCRPDGKQKSFDKLIKYVHHVHLRDSTKSKLQVRIGQGEIEYGRLVNQLSQANFNRALTVHLDELEGLDHMAEMRKMRLLLESLL